MPTIDVVVSSPVSQTMRCRQVEALFDVPPQVQQTLRWSGDVPLDERSWNVGLIVGASGSGKSTVARALFGPDALRSSLEWSADSVLDDFPANTPLADIAAICQAVGFNTIPAWLRPFSVLSNGEQFRVMLARKLIESPSLTVIDEFTSVVDRQVAKIGSHAVQKYVRKNNMKFVAVSCHHDIVEWLNPDWILEPATMAFAWRSLQRRPSVNVEIARVDYSAWRLFAPFHYLTSELHTSAQCFALFVGECPAAFCAVLHRPISQRGKMPIWGISRVVTLPDYQGLGFAFVLTDAIGAALKACRQRLHNYPAHPAYVRALDRSPAWRLESRPSLRGKNSSSSRGTLGEFGGRPNAVFSYAGPAAPDVAKARQFLGIPSLSSAT